MAEEELHLVQVELALRDPRSRASVTESVRVQVVDPGLEAAALHHPEHDAIVERVALERVEEAFAARPASSPLEEELLEERVDRDGALFRALAERWIR